MKGCVFCEIASGDRDADVVFADDRFVAFLDHRPVFPGHTLVVPRRHVDDLEDLPDALARPLTLLTRRVAGAVRSALSAEGTFVAMNNRVSQSVPHFHVHVVPRTKGDGLRGFFWPRTPYEDERHRDRIRRAIAAALDS